MATDDPWMNDAACRGADLRLWFARKGDNSLTRQARKICAACPVRTDCLHHAMVNVELFGMWGGHTPKELRVMRRRAGITHQGRPAKAVA